MINFVRDQAATNITLNEHRIKQINAIFTKQASEFNSKINNNSHQVLLFYTIRFDDKGFKTQSLDQLLQYFHLARKIERILFTLETPDSIQSNRINGTYMELVLDKGNPKNCFLRVASDNFHDWVDLSFTRIQDVLFSYKNEINKWARTILNPLIIQIFGIFIGSLLSLLGASKISPALSIDSSTSFIICFFLFFLIFSSIWFYLNKLIIEQIINKFFPIAQFDRSDTDNKLSWLIRAIISSIIIFILVALIHFTYLHSVEIINPLIKTKIILESNA